LHKRSDIKDPASLEDQRRDRFYSS
jgi:hypothetical protein